MTFFWLAAGAILGLINTGSQWWIVQNLSPEQGRSSAILLVLGSGTLRIVLSAVLLLLALQQGLLSGIIFLTGQTATRWLFLYVMNKKQNEFG